MDCKLTLRNLLRLDAGALEPAERDALRAAIGQSVPCQRVWRLFSQQSARIEAGLVELGERSQPDSQRAHGASSAAVELVACYLDGTLGNEPTRQLERRALTDPDLLAELMLHFRGQADSAGAEPLPWAVTERLFALGEELKREGAAAPKPLGTAKTAGAKNRPQEKIVRLPGEAVDALKPRPAPIQMARSVAPASVRQPARRQANRWAMMAAAVTSGAALFGLWFAYHAWTSAPAESRLVGNNERREPAVAAGTAGPANMAATAQAGSTRSDRSGAGIDSRQGLVGGQSGWALVSLDDAREEDNTGWQIDPAASVFHQFNGHIADCKWLALEGIVALREPGDDLWFGPRSTAQTANGLEWRTLPDSWATARLGGLGEIVLDSDSAVVVNVSSPENLLALDVAGGRIGLKKLPAELRLQIKHDRVTWDVAILEQGSSLGIDWLDGEPRLAVQTGQVRVGDRVLARNEQMVWSSTTESRAGDAARVQSVTSPLPEPLAWLDQPVRRAVVSGAAQAELLASGNVIAEMNRLGQSGASQGQVLAQHLPAILAPEAQLLDVLEGADATSRDEALDWLLSLSPRSPKTRQIWRSISQRSGVPELAPEYFRLVQVIRNSALVVESDAEFLTAGLKHERLFVREMSQALLELRFGNTVQYDATDSDLRRRNQMADRWTREILAGYHPTAVPKR